MTSSGIGPEFWRSPAAAAALANCDIPSLMRYIRAEYGWSQSRLGAALGYSQSWVSRVMSGEHRVTVDQVRDIALRLGVPPGALRFAGGGDRTERRQFGQLAASAGVAVVVPAVDPDEEDRLATVISSPSRLDRQAISYLAVTLDAQRRLEDTIGSASLVGSVVAQLRLIQRLVAGARGPLRPTLVDVAGQWAQFAGWLYASLSQPGNATAWWDLATRWAAEAGDDNLVATVTSFRGNLAWRSGEVDEAMRLTDAALRIGRDPAGSACEYYLLARAQATLNDADAAHRSLERAAWYAADSRPSNTAPWGYYYLAPGFFTLTHGLVLQCLAQHDPRYHSGATNMLASGLAELPVDMRHSDWAGVYVLRLAAAYARAGDLDNAEKRATEAGTIAVDTGSPSLAKRVDAFLNKLSTR